MDAGADDAAALAHGLQGERHQVADRREEDRRVERRGRRLVRRAGPGRAELEGERARPRVLAPGERENLATLRARDLGDEVRGGAEPVEPDAAAVACLHERAPADEARAEERRERGVVTFFAERERVARVGDRRRGEPAVARVPGEERPVAEVLLVTPARLADAAGEAEPRNADPRPDREPGDTGPDRVDASDDLVTEDDRKLRIREISVGDVEVRSADTARGDPDAKLARARLRIGELDRLERRARLLECHRQHGFLGLVEREVRCGPRRSLADRLRRTVARLPISNWSTRTAISG